MKLIEEIKKAEETAEKMKRDAEKKGQELLEAEYEVHKKALANLDGEQEDLIKKKCAEANRETEKEIKILRKKHEQEIGKIDDSFKKNREKAIKTVQKIIFQWPSSR